MRYLTVDAELNGTGIRDTYDSGDVVPKRLGLSDDLCERISDWVERYGEHHCGGYANRELSRELDREGLEISKELVRELVDVKVIYWSDAFLTGEQVFV